MNRDEVLNVLRAHKATLAQRFGVTELALFGSFARDQATDESDVDILVRFDKPATSDAFFGTQFYLEDLLGRSVDLATTRDLRVEIRPYVEREVIDV
ncbi:MAG: nucleotidyltransferase family protein [Gemmatimonadota bacterium]|nr:nucleotidyltransferase family protein [Gemmatimonadota bacterium]